MKSVARRPQVRQEDFHSSCAVNLKTCSQELSALLKLAQALAAETDGARLPRQALQYAAHLLGFEGGLIWQTKPGTANLSLASTLSLPPSLLAATPAELESEAGAAGQALARREPVRLSIEAWSGPEALQRSLRTAGVQTLLGIPLLAYGNAMGVMVLITTRHLGGSFSKKDLAATLGAVVGVALLHAREHAALIQEERLAALGLMAAGVAHELKTPLTVFLGRTEMLVHQAKTRPFLTADDVIRSANALHEAAQRMKRIVDGLSLYSKPPKAEPEPLDVIPLLKAVQDVLGYSARKAGIELRVEEPASGDLALLADRGYLLQVLLNLGTNAVEATDRGGTVRFNARRGEGPEVIIEVSDNGSGIPPEVVRRIWEPFFTTKAEGTGLGLAIVRTLVQKMGGTIRVESESGRGTLFRLHFPEASGA